MKNLIIGAFVISVIIFNFIYCGSGDGKMTGDKLIVVSTITIINDMVKNIGGDKVEAISICGIGFDPHTYKSVPGDSKIIASADIVFMNGFGLEGWIEKLIRAAGSNKPVYATTDGIEPLRDDRGHGDPDPHCWFDARLAKIYVDNISSGLIEVDPENSEYYSKNALAYKIQLDSLHSYAAEMISQIPEQYRILVTSHDAFRYFGEAYGIRVEALQGISTEAKAQTADVAELVDLIKKFNLPAVFIETSVNPKLLEQIASETQAKIGGVLFSDSIGDEGTAGGSYIGAFKYNVETITNALKVNSVAGK
ncbi:MAG: zinc ABC transporter substrate-binding protein [Ignavibacteriaceae bacterium]